MNFAIKFYKFGFVGWLSLAVYSYITFLVYTSGSFGLAIFAMLWAFLFQLKTGLRVESLPKKA